MSNTLRYFTVNAIIFFLFCTAGFAQTTRNVGAGQTYTTVASALSAASSGDIINIVDATHIEHDIAVNINVTIQGQGAHTTTIQAAATANSGIGRIFDVGAATVTIQDLTIRYGDYSGAGGGINLADGGTLTIQDCRLTQNRASNGGGAVYTHGALTMNRCSIDNNSTTGWYGGGICTWGGRTTILTNCTIANNSAPTESGGIENPGYLFLTNCTIAGNSASVGGAGVGCYGGSVTAKNTIFADNTSGNCSGTSITSQGYNIESGTDCGCTGTGDQQSTDPMLGSLGDNGGPTPTMALSSLSPAINPASSNGAPASDQRGASRVDNADIGAFEYNGPLPVELTSFAACVRNGKVLLEWHTASEMNNYGFEVQRNIRGVWESIGFVNGHGTSNAPRGYSFADIRPPASDVLTYRLKQIDRDGSYEYSGMVEAHFGNTVHAPALASNYPNPFSASTSISYVLPHATQTSLRIFDVHGILVNVLVNRYQQEGSYSIAFSAGDLPAGTYLIQLETPTGLDVSRMTVAR